MVKIAHIMRDRMSSVRSRPLRQAEKSGDEKTNYHFVELFGRKSVKNDPPPKVEVSKKNRNQGEDAEKTYADAVAVAENMFRQASLDMTIDYREVGAAVDGILQGIVVGNEELISMACSPGNERTNYLHAHPVNSTILSIAVGIEGKLNMSKLRELGVCAFLHDVGVAKISDLVGQGENLSAAEIKTVRKHPAWGLETLRKVKDVSDSVLKVVYEEHERLDGSGYPHGIVGKDRLNEFTCTVAVADVFEALTHKRPHREAMAVNEAVKHMLKSSEAAKYDAGIMRSLISRIGLYPVGSWLKLSTDEVAKVVGINAGHPLKPKVKVVFDRGGWKLNQSKIIDLTYDASIQIVKAMSENDVKHLFP